MLPAKQIGCGVLLLLSLCTATAAEQGVSGLDEPSTGGFYPWRQSDRAVAEETSPIGRTKACGLGLRPLLWQPGQAIHVCFRSGTQKARARVAQIAGEWLQYANLKFDFGDIANP